MREFTIHVTMRDTKLSNRRHRCMAVIAGSDIFDDRWCVNLGQARQTEFPEGVDRSAPPLRRL